jgi:hypothetical protein
MRYLGSSPGSFAGTRLPASRLGLPGLITLALCAVSLAGCQGSGPDNPSPDMAVDLARAADLSQPPDLAPLRCQLPYDERAIDMVSMGAVSVAPDPGDPNTQVAQIDATAGGPQNYGNNPFVYLDLIAGKKVDITDVQAGQSQAWDIALKRWQIKLNSGDSGPGGVTEAIVDGKDLKDVTVAPAGPYMADSYFDAKCNVQLDPIGGLLTALSDWYDYDTGTNQLTPKQEVIVLTRRDKKGHIKLQITGYYKGMAGGNFTISWSLLP